MSKLKIGTAGLLSATLGFLVQGCFAAQPAPECNIVSGQAAFGVSNYYATLTNKQSTGTCTDAPSNDLDHLEIGMFRFSPPGKPMSVAIRTSYIVDAWNGYIYSGNADGTNDCSATTSPGKCVYCIADGGGATATFRDAGTAVAVLEDGGFDLLADGGFRGIVYPAGDGGTRVSLTNRCRTTIEEIGRTDPADPDGEKLNAWATIPTYPTANVCKLTQVDGGIQNFEAVPLVGGSSLPAITVATEWTDLNVVNNTKAPGTYWTAKLAITEGPCKTTYDVTAFYPIIHCEGEDAMGNPIADDTLCDPSADLDAGRVFGSGISPAFKPKCDANLFVCVPTATAAELAK